MTPTDHRCAGTKKDGQPCSATILDAAGRCARHRLATAGATDPAMAFLALIAEGHGRQTSAEQAWSVEAMQRRIDHDPDFEDALNQAEARACEPLEKVIYERGLNGDLKSALAWLYVNSGGRWVPAQKMVGTIEHVGTVVHEGDTGDAIARILALQERLEARAFARGLIAIEQGEVIDAEAIEEE